jgi:hypothetical protein
LSSCSLVSSLSCSLMISEFLSVLYILSLIPRKFLNCVL